MKRRNIKEYRFFVEAWILLALSRALILFRPFKALTPILGESVDEETANGILEEHISDKQLLLLIKRSIWRAAKRSPWRTMCFEQALTARIMLRLRNIKSVVFFGVNRHYNSEETMKAHAWLICSGFAVTGGANNSDYTTIGRFVK